ncbi:hypothetical protein WN55_06058, partial [Dufourea novaeangliae]
LIDYIFSILFNDLLPSFVSVCVFNEGREPLLTIMDLLGVNIGRYAKNFAVKRDLGRIAEANRRSTSASKEDKVARKKEKSELEVEYEVTEGLLYGAVSYLLAD